MPTADPNPPTGRPAAPTPATMAGRRDPALTVKPVDYATAARNHARRSTASTPADSPAVNDDAPSVPKPLTTRQREDLVARITAALEQNSARAWGTQNTLYSVVSGTPVPTGETLKLSAPEANVPVVGAWEATLEDLQQCVEDPEDSWSADLGRTDYFLRGDLCVQIRRTDGQIMGIYRAGWALARRPDSPLPEEPGSGRSASGGRGTRYPTNQAELLKRLRAAGFVVVTSGPTHGKITHPDHPRRFLPYASTPSGQRYGRHVVTAVKRVFGIDLRD